MDWWNMIVMVTYTRADDCNGENDMRGVVEGCDEA